MTVAPTSVHPGREHPFRWLLIAILAFLLGGLAVALLYGADVFEGSSSSSGVQGSGVAASETRDVRPFASVELAGSNNVVIRVGAQQSVVVKADDNLLDRVTTRVQSGTLVIGNTPGSFSTKSPMSVEVGVPTLSALTLSGSGNIVVGGLEAASLAVTLPGSGTLTASGTTTRLGVTVSGSGMVQFSRLDRKRRAGSRERLGHRLRYRDRESRRIRAGSRHDRLCGRPAGRDQEHHRDGSDHDHVWLMTKARLRRLGSGDQGAATSWRRPQGRATCLQSPEPATA